MAGTLAATSLGALLTGGAHCPDPLLVKVHGTSSVQGKWHDDQPGAAREFLGIPYAVPPVGELRFAPPEPAQYWSGVLDATAYGDQCVQNGGSLGGPAPTEGYSEDCLSVNVFTPPDAKKNSKLPVMVFIPGGGFVSGGALGYEGWRLAEEYGVVVVTLNYRLGALGFLSHPALDAEMGEPQSGNMGLKDQQLALKWVQRNIRSFGGDPKNVTLFGESAGSMSTCVQLVAPGSQKLVDKFIMESGVCVGGLPIITKAQSDALGSSLADAFCAGEPDTVACLRDVPAVDLVAWGANQGISGAGWGPVIVPGSEILPAHPTQLIAAGEYNPGPVIIGSNANEWGLFQLFGAVPRANTIAEFNANVAATFGPLAPALQAFYAPASDAEANQKLVDLMTDSLFRCPSRAFARLATSMGSDVWLYSFDFGSGYHATELPYVFGVPFGFLAWQPVAEPLVGVVQSYWTQFAHESDPNGAGMQAWPAYETSTDLHMSLQLPHSVGSGLAADSCDFWDAIAAQSM